jgi:hypothetical protein
MFPKDSQQRISLDFHAYNNGHPIGLSATEMPVNPQVPVALNVSSASPYSRSRRRQRLCRESFGFSNFPRSNLLGLPSFGFASPTAPRPIWKNENELLLKGPPFGQRLDSRTRSFRARGARTALSAGGVEWCSGQGKADLAIRAPATSSGCAQVAAAARKRLDAPNQLQSTLRP